MLIFLLELNCFLGNFFSTPAPSVRPLIPLHGSTFPKAMGNAFYLIGLSQSTPIINAQSFSKALSRLSPVTFSAKALHLQKAPMAVVSIVAETMTKA